MTNCQNEKSLSKCLFKWDHILDTHIPMTLKYTVNVNVNILNNFIYML